jgi:hypothetical protein
MFLAFTGLLWLVVAVVTLVCRGELTRHLHPVLPDV